MRRTALLEDQFKELLTLGEQVLGTRRPPPPGVIGDNRVDAAKSEEWRTSTAQLFARVFGKQSEYYMQLQKDFQCAGFYSDMLHGLAILKAAWNDYSKGYLFETKSLVQAEVFDDFLEQAGHLCDQGYHQAAAVLCGEVLEDSLRQLCQRTGVLIAAKPKLDQMNADLAKAGVYNALVQKSITWLADIRNKAAHGKWTDFTSEDVRTMLRQTRNIITEHLA